MTAPTMAHRLTAEFLGTFLLVVGGCGAAVLAANPAGDRTAGIGFTGVALAFGLSLLAGTYAFGSISGAHFNPAVTVGAAMAGRIEWEAVLKYWVAQVLGALAGGGAIYLIASGRPKFNANSNMAASGYEANSPFHYSMVSVLIAETVLAALFLLVFLASTGDRGPKWFAGLSVGLTYALIHLIALPVSNTLINPAASTGVAFFNGAGAPVQLWAFWIAPIVGAGLGAWAHSTVFVAKDDQAGITAD